LVPKLVAVATSISTAGPHITHDSWGPPSPQPKRHLSLQSFLHRWPQSVFMLYSGAPLPPSKLPLPMGDLDPI